VLSAAARHGAPATALAARLGGSATVEAYGAVLGRCAVEKKLGFGKGKWKCGWKKCEKTIQCFVFFLVLLCCLRLWLILVCWLCQS